jgi:hypothetical protein
MQALPKAGVVTTWALRAKLSSQNEEWIMTKRAWWKEKASGRVNARGYVALLPFVTASVVLASNALFAAH